MLASGSSSLGRGSTYISISTPPVSACVRDAFSLTAVRRETCPAKPLAIPDGDLLVLTPGTRAGPRCHRPSFEKE